MGRRERAAEEAAAGAEPVIEPSPERKEEIRESVKKLLRQKDVMNFTLGQHFAEILDGSYWQDYGFQSFDEYCTKEADCHRRKGLDLAKIYRKFGLELTMSAEDIQGYPYSKLALVANVITLHNRDGWLKDVLKLTFDQLKYKVAEYAKTQADRGAGNSPKSEEPSGDADPDGDDDDDEKEEPLVLLKVRMRQSQYDNLKAAIELAGRMTGSDKENYLLDCIATDFVTGNQDENDLPLQTKLQALERIHKPCNITVTFPKGDARAADFVADRDTATKKKKKGREQREAQDDKVTA